MILDLVLKVPRASGLMQKSSLVFEWSLLKKGPKNIFRHGLPQQWAKLACVIIGYSTKKRASRASALRADGVPLRVDY